MNEEVIPPIKFFKNKTQKNDAVGSANAQVNFERGCTP